MTRDAHWSAKLVRRDKHETHMSRIQVIFDFFDLSVVIRYMINDGIRFGVHCIMSGLQPDATA